MQINNLIPQAKGQLPSAFSVGSALPFFNSLLPAGPYGQPGAGFDVTNNRLIPGPDDSPRDLEEAIAELGFEALAFYISFHKPTADDEWGIFYIGSRMLKLGALVRQRSLRSIHSKPLH